MGREPPLMQLFHYRAARADGAIVSGLMEAPTDGEANATLIQRGLHPLRLQAADVSGGRHPPASRRDLAMVFRSISALVAAGMPIERAVAASEPLARGRLREALVEARSQLRAGRSLAQSLDNTRGLIPSIVIGMLRAGERASQLGLALEQVATQLEQEAELASRLRQALAYPVLLLVAGAASVLIIGTVVVPRFAVILGDLGQELPLASRALLAGSFFISQHGVVLLLGCICFGWVFLEWVRRPSGRLQWDRLLLELPVLGPLRHSLASARICRALGGMLHAGMPLLSALEAARDAAGDRAVGERLGQTRNRVAEGQALAPSLERERALSSSALQLLAVGETSGQLTAMCARAGDLSAQEAERGLKTIVGLIEPGMVVFFGGLVAFVAAALLQAVYSIRPMGH